MIEQHGQIPVSQLDFQSSLERGLIHEGQDMLIDLYQFERGLQVEIKDGNSLLGPDKIGFQVQKGSYLGGVVAAIEFIHPLLRIQNHQLAMETELFRRLAIHSTKKGWHNRELKRIGLFINIADNLVQKMLKELGVVIFDIEDADQQIAA